MITCIVCGYKGNTEGSVKCQCGNKIGYTIEEINTIKTKNTIHIKEADCIVCTKCENIEWEMSFKRYGNKNTFVYCKNKKCQEKIKPDIKKIKEYSLYLFTKDKEEAKAILLASLAKLDLEKD